MASFSIAARRTSASLRRSSAVGTRASSTRPVRLAPDDRAHHRGDTAVIAPNDHGRWWRDAVIYEIYVRSFADSDGDGVGDLAGIRERLDYLSMLGVDGVWLTPFYP